MFSCYCSIKVIHNIGKVIVKGNVIRVCIHICRQGREGSNEWGLLGKQGWIYMAVQLCCMI